MAGTCATCLGPCCRARCDTDPVSEFGFVDEAPRDGPAGASGGDRPRRSPTRTVSRSLVRGLFAGLVLGLLAFAGWAWSGRLAADDLAAWDTLHHEFVLVDRSLPPLGHGDLPPCHSGTEGTVTRDYPSTGPLVTELVDVLVGRGWEERTPTPPAVARLVLPAGDRELTVDVTAASREQLVQGLVARSPASAFACLGR